MEARPLAHQLGIGAGVHHLVRGRAREVIGADVADAIAAGLDRVHLDRRKVREGVGAIFQLDPVVLDVLAGGEVAVAAIILVGDVGEHLHLARIERAIGDRDAQHIGVELEVEPVHQPQRLELVLGQLAFEAAAGLIAEFGDAGIDHRLVVLVIAVHQRVPVRTGRRSVPRMVPSSLRVLPSTGTCLCAARIAPKAACVAGSS